MTAQSCIAVMEKAAGRPLSPEEADDLLTELEQRIAQEEAIGGLDDLDARVRKAADDYASEMAAKAVIAKRNAAISLLRRLEAIDKVTSQFAANPALGVESVLTGTNAAVKGSRLSAASHQTVLDSKYKQALVTRLIKADVLDVYDSGAMDREVANALWLISRKDPQPIDHLPKEAQAIAKAISDTLEQSRVEANQAGAWIKKLEGYIVRQSHDSFKIIRATYPVWRDAILPKLDLARTLDGGKDVDAFLRGVYQGLASGIHLKTPTGEPTAFKGGRNLAKKVSEERVLHFNSADDWFDYNQQFGMGSLRESVAASLSRSAQDTGLMKVLGPNPEANLSAIIDSLKRTIKDPAKLQKFSEKAEGMLKNRYAEVSGLTRVPVNHIVASRSASVRAVQSMAKLGGALLSQFGDTVSYGAEMRYQGRYMLSGLGESIAAVGKRVKAEERAEFYNSLGVFFESMSGHWNDRFSIADDGVHGGIAKAQQLFFKLNLMRTWAERQKASAVSAFAHHLALKAGGDYAALGPDMQRVLSLYGIGDAQWKIIRQATETADDGRLYATPTAIESMPAEAFTDFVSRGGVKVTANRIATARREVADQLRAYYVDRASFAQLTPDARTRSVINQGTRPGTVTGELWRFMMQFKSFSVAVVQKTLGRELYGRGAPVDATFFKALTNGKGEMLGLANVILYSALMGYGSMTAKELVKGRKPRAIDSPGAFIKTFSAALTQGGGLGIYGDFLFGEANRFGGGAIQTAAGPTIGTMGDLIDLSATLRDPNTSNPMKELAAQAFRQTVNNTPFLNLFYTRMALDYLLLWNMQEAISPGSLKRMERRVQKENHQEFLVRPSQHRLRVFN